LVELEALQTPHTVVVVVAVRRSKALAALVGAVTCPVSLVSRPPLRIAAPVVVVQALTVATLLQAAQVPPASSIWCSMSKRFVWLALALVFIHGAAHAQTLRTIDKGTDSALVITTLPRCTTACPDSLAVEWKWGGLVVVRTVPARAVDTLRVRKQLTQQSVVVRLLPYKWQAAASVLLGALPNVPPPPVPVDTAVAPPDTAQTGTSPFVIPALPAVFQPHAPSITRVVPVAVDADLQAAINGSQAGDVLELAAGVWVGNYVLQGNGRTIRCAMLHACRIETQNTEAAIRTAPGASNWLLRGLDIAHNPPANAEGYHNYGIVVLGRGDESTLASLPSGIWLDSVLVHSTATAQTRRCIAFNGIRLAVTNSALTECHAKGADAQGVGGWNGPGPFLISGNVIEASGQGVMFGGADPRIPNVSPSDITITNNQITKPLSWGRGKWTVKAAFELKHARRVLFSGNLIQNHWADAQTGFAILLQTLSDNNTAWGWTTVADVTIRNNRIENSTSGINILGRVAYGGGILPTNPTSRILLQNNLFNDVGKDPFQNTASMAVQLLGDLVDVSIDRNTFLCNCQMQKAISFDGKPGVRTTITDNIFPASSYVLTGNGTGPGSATLNVFMPGGLFQRNTLPGARAQDYSPNQLGNALGADTTQLRKK